MEETIEKDGLCPPFAFLLLDFVFPNFLMLELKNKKFRFQIRILREMSFLEPAPKVWKPKSKSL